MENSPKKKRQGRKTQRTLAGAAALTLGLTGAGLLASALTPNTQVATAARDDQAMIQEGKDLYDVACITCHGANLQGVEDRGPSLIGTGEGAVYFQVNSGRMPMASNDAQAERKRPRYTEEQALALAAYVAANGGGPELVYNEDGSLAMEELRGKDFDGQIQAADVARGSELFRLNCASCHSFTGRGGALSSGKYAPHLDPANEQEIYQAMLTGPQNMPVFSDSNIKPEDKRDIIAYLKTIENQGSPGGLALGSLGPVSEGLFIWTAGLALIIGFMVWLTSRSS